MARMLFPTVILKSQSLIRNSPTLVPSRFINLRYQSKKTQLLELDLGSDKSESDARRRKLEEEIEAIIVRTAAPDWLLFVPGSSYWVPPTATATTTTTTMMEETYFPPVRGWPSFLILLMVYCHMR